MLQGLGMAAVLMLGQDWLVHQGWSTAQGRSVVFGTLVLGVMLLILTHRDATRSIWQSLSAPNPWLPHMGLGMAALVVTMLGLPWLRDLMGLAVPPIEGLAACAILIALCMLWLALMRQVKQGLTKR